ncbi:hypothetical protein KSS87_019892 [Heliosperma pusillum]|nr:hypothetical protein KSS87_019892 [Heliosperma pusillum]
MPSRKEVLVEEHGRQHASTRAIMSKENTADGETSFRVYYGTTGAAVPFMWESHPGKIQMLHQYRHCQRSPHRVHRRRRFRHLVLLEGRMISLIGKVAHLEQNHHFFMMKMIMVKWLSQIQSCALGLRTSIKGVAQCKISRMQFRHLEGIENFKCTTTTINNKCLLI